MPRSTAKFISYDLRPAKQSERRILIDLLKLGSDCGLPVEKYRYVGMGANRFYDFLLLHKYLGISNMVSLEHDPVMFKRAAFNVPYRFIDVQPKSCADFIREDSLEAPAIFWLDYDGGISSSIAADIASFGLRMKIGDFCFVTVFGGPPKAIENENDEGRLIWLQENLGDIAGTLDRSDAQKSNFPDAVHKLLMAAFKNVFAPRLNGEFVPLLQVEYSDSKPMVTVGGAFLSSGDALSYRSRIEASMPFLHSKGEKLYEIKSLNLTERERALFDRAVTAKSNRTSERNLLRKLGFKDSEISAYKDLVRYFPRYVETMV